MAVKILSIGQESTPDNEIINGNRTHLMFQREGGTRDVLVQASDDSLETPNWRNIARISATTTDEQQIAIFASQGYNYRVIVDGSTPNADTEVTYAESSDPIRLI